MTCLPAHLLSPDAQARMDREAESASQRAFGVRAVLVPVLLIALACGGLVLLGGWLVNLGRMGP